MSKTIIIKLTKASTKSGPFTISDGAGNIIASDVSIYSLIEGLTYEVDDSVTTITLTSTGACKVAKTMPISTITPLALTSEHFTEVKTACLHRHLTNPTINNCFYGNIEPYIIEYPVSTSPNTEILQSIKSYDKVFKYALSETGVFSYTDKIQVDNIWFDNAIIYSNQQCTGLLELVPKPKNNLQAYNAYPIYNSNSKTITYTKSDDCYNINGFYDIVKDRTVPIAITSCESLSYDGILNQSNMDYSNRSFRKSLIRAKDNKIRLTLNTRSDVHIVSQFAIVSSQISYK